MSYGAFNFPDRAVQSRLRSGYVVSMRPFRHKTLKHAPALGWALACVLTFGTLAGLTHDHAGTEVPEPCVLCVHSIGDDLHPGGSAHSIAVAAADTEYLSPLGESFLDRAIRGVSARGPPSA